MRYLGMYQYPRRVLCHACTAFCAASTTISHPLLPPPGPAPASRQRSRDRDTRPSAVRYRECAGILGLLGKPVVPVGHHDDVEGLNGSVSQLEPPLRVGYVFRDRLQLADIRLETDQRHQSKCCVRAQVLKDLGVVGIIRKRGRHREVGILGTRLGADRVGGAIDSRTRLPEVPVAAQVVFALEDGHVEALGAKILRSREPGISRPDHADRRADAHAVRTL